MKCGIRWRQRMGKEFRILKRKKEGVVILDVMGDLTTGSNDQAFKALISDLVSQHQNDILVNLEGVEFIDSSGVGALVKSYTTTLNRGGHLKLMHAGSRIRHTLKATGLIGVFEVFENEASAISSF